MAPTPVLLPGKSHGQRRLVGCRPQGCKELDMFERLHFHFSLSCIGEGNGNPLQCSCLENPRDGRAWWAAVYGVAQSQTRLKRLSSNSSEGAYQKFNKGSCSMEWEYLLLGTGQTGLCSQLCLVDTRAGAELSLEISKGHYWKEMHCPASFLCHSQIL